MAGSCYTIVGCLCFVSYFLGLVVMLPLMLSLYGNPTKPSLSINLFDNQEVNITKEDGSPKKLTIPFHLMLENLNSAMGLHYPDPIKVTFSYFPNVSMMVTLAEYKISSFYQGNGKTKNVKDIVETNITPTVLEGTDMVAFRVDLMGTYRLKKVGTKRHKIDVGCLVFVNYTTSQKIGTGFFGLYPPGLDSQLEPPSDDDY